MKRYFLSITYKGISYKGWQKQPHGNTIQNHLEKAFCQVYQPTKVVGSSRTDTQVHAYNQIAHIDVPDELHIPQLRYQLNAVLPTSIHINHITPVSPHTHARFHAQSRTYHYYITQEKSPFTVDTAYFLPKKLDVDKMNESAQRLLGIQNFQSFCKKKSDVQHHICNIMKAHWSQIGHRYTFCIQANRFLHGMVRTIVGVLVAIGNNQLSIDELKRIIKAKNRCLAGPALPAHALFLVDVNYLSTYYVDPAKDAEDLEKQKWVDLPNIFQ